MHSIAKPIQIGAAVILILLLVWFVMAYSRYQEGLEQAADILGGLNKMRQEYIIAFQSQGHFPRSNTEARLPAPEAARFGAIEAAVVMKDERLYLRILDHTGARSQLFLTPEMNSNNQFSWFCRSPDLSEFLQENLFQGCQRTTETLTLEQAAALQGKPRPKRGQPQPAKLDIKLPPPPPAPEPEPIKPCEVSAPRELLIHDHGIGIWDFSATPVLEDYIPIELANPTAIAARIGSVLFIAKGNYIHYADTRKQPVALQKSSVWIKPGTRIYSVGQQLLWITPENQLFVGDVCYPPNIRIIHNTKLRMSGRDLASLKVAEGKLHLLSRYPSDWSNRSKLDIYGIKNNGTLVHAFSFSFTGFASSMYREEPYLLIANGRDGLSIKQRTSDFRWMETEAISAMDFVMDAVIKDNTLWVADRSAGLIIYRRRSGKEPWEQVDQREFEFPAFELRWFEHGILVSSATRHAWVAHDGSKALPLQPPSAPESR
ncbi:hypothetical protein [Ketobacter sp.]|uniref:hypothetical protein n=1 Tax=Ketobacter sp. TaxID=2083498 RepID=UPI000F195876|nr:hypothetical protein [Ketobacter sp.]RLU00681.1 MAG: hypothetical protein D9N14_05280 [Ketobacter sp.]